MRGQVVRVEWPFLMVGVVAIGWSSDMASGWDEMSVVARLGVWSSGHWLGSTE
ncbi:unnamed protein product [Staurois parvus]|uniref:Uncharacterized protein n=1 Tax=Staurois parvus TaxID=386267 RepID=A0ABN9HLS6_9NEOB|nr:unnamed protein product [Staurois parvus]